MVLLQKPQNFTAQFTAAGCFMLCDDQILLLLRQDHKPQGGTWGTPGGKVEKGESALIAVRRELMEETGIVEQYEMRELQPTYVRLPDLDFVYLMFVVKVNQKPAIKLDPSSHKNYIWINLNEVSQLPCIHGLAEHLILLKQQL